MHKATPNSDAHKQFIQNTEVTFSNKILFFCIGHYIKNSAIAKGMSNDDRRRFFVVTLLLSWLKRIPNRKRL